MRRKNEQMSINLDEKDKQIIEILQYDAREKLTSISKKVGLSIDSVNKRIKRLVENNIIYFRSLPDPRKIGFPFIVDAKIKLHNVKEDEFNEFMKYLTVHPLVTTLLTVSGDWDVTCVFMARTSKEIEEFTLEVRKRFSHLIAEWKGVLVLRTYKFEEYKL